jgi:outer membrane protein OmpA-like peptidoglycan-associated protein
MTVRSTIRNSFPGQVAVLALASALSLSAAAQQPANGSSNPTPAATQPSPGAQSQNMSAPPQEGFWGKVNPFARKKWVNKRLDPIKGQLNELDEVNAKNAQDIKDVDSRAQAGINKAQTTADAANQVATAAGTQAQQANTVAGQATTKVGQINTTVNGLDTYAEKNAMTIKFRPGSTVLSKDAKDQLDQMAANLTGHQGYVLEIQAYAPAKGSAGITSSDRLAEAVKRYLVTEHEIPVYRMHSVALGNMPAAGSNADATEAKIRTNHVELRLMENSLAAQDGQTPRLSSSQTGASQP